MKAQDLRIGNLVDVINRSQEVHLPFNIIKKVGRIEFFNVDLYDYEKPFAAQPLNWTVDIADLSPIPLTEEWLVKFGFIKDFYGFVLDDKMSLSFSTKLSPFWQDSPLSINIQYVHQLQNLYFALTGSELEIK